MVGKFCITGSFIELIYENWNLEFGKWNFEF
jgi:hypothetical protein